MSALGIAGMTSAFVYVFAVYLAFQPGFSDLTYLFVGRSDRELPLFVFTGAVPYVFLMAHLYLRTKLGAVLLKQGAIQEAIDYTSTKLRPSLLRSSTEAAFHRLHLAQALVRELRYDEAITTLDALKTPPRRLKEDYLRWTLEILLRQENLKRANGLIPSIRKSKGSEVGCAWAAAAELACRQNDQKAFDDAWKHALWALPAEHPRLAFTAQCAARRFGIPVAGDDATEFLIQVPGAALEWAIMRNNPTPETPGDARSEWVAQQGVIKNDNTSNR